MLPLTYSLTLALLASSSFAAPAAELCNGRAAYCDRKYAQMSFVGAHNSPFVGPLPQHNQDISVTKQLDLGIRYLQGQTHKDPDGVLSMCHTSCQLEHAGSLTSYLATVKKWLDGHPDEVVTLLITNGDRLDIKEFDDSFGSAGVKNYIFVPPSSPQALPIDKWPTMRELIKSGKRMIVFLDYKADVKRVPYILDQYEYYFETPFSTTDPNFRQCKIDRPPGAKENGRMYVVNHNLNVNLFGVLVPDRIRAPRTNAATGPGSIGAHAGLCHSIYKRNPNVVLVDFITMGDVFKAERTMNGV
ncbi:hypothetical protein FQN57_002025 [Myotisia sp. PD_48]|nr:hypothetical protein FQN57_002025 [Myotisia sp. PD_48]